MKTGKEKLGVAVIGLGAYGAEEIIPALQKTDSCYLAGIVTGDDSKREKIKSEYHLAEKNCYSYSDFDEVAGNSDIDIVYIVLPNEMHAEYIIRAAKAGKHIICEKPLVTNLEDCRRVSEAVEAAGVRCSVGYRLHFDPFHRELMRWGQQQTFGEIINLEICNSMVIDSKSAWRLKGKLAGGGPLFNNGVYCVQAAIYITGLLPVAVEAQFAPVTDPERFAEVEEGVRWNMYFENDIIASCECGYSKNQDTIRVNAENGWIHLEPAFEYRGLKGATSAGVMDFPEINQQARQMDDFAECIIYNKPSRVPLGMGIRDIKILSAIYKSAQQKERITLDLTEYAHLPEL